MNDSHEPFERVLLSIVSEVNPTYEKFSEDYNPSCSLTQPVVINGCSASNFRENKIGSCDQNIYHATSISEDRRTSYQDFIIDDNSLFRFLRKKIDTSKFVFEIYRNQKNIRPLIYSPLLRRVTKVNMHSCGEYGIIHIESAL